MKSRRVFLCFFLIAFCAGAAAQDRGKASEYLSRGLAAAGQTAWPLALEYFTKAHEAAPRDSAVFYYLGVAHQNAGNLLPAMAWYAAYLAGRTEPDKAAFARREYKNLETSILGSLHILLDAARKLAAVNNELDYVARTEAEAGLLSRWRATRRMIKEGGHQSFSRERDDIADFLHRARNAGDIGVLRDNHALLVPAELYSKTQYATPQYEPIREELILTEISRFVHLSNRDYRIQFTERLSANDPLGNEANLKPRVEHILSNGEQAVDRLCDWARVIGIALMEVRASYPSASDGYLSEDALSYLKLRDDLERGGNGRVLSVRSALFSDVLQKASELVKAKGNPR